LYAQFHKKPKKYSLKVSILTPPSKFKFVFLLGLCFAIWGYYPTEEDMPIIYKKTPLKLISDAFKKNYSLNQVLIFFY